ncbi:MAG: cytidylate kinase family protein, partial [Candidatus Aenigmarchaeota archaeon]|nr:cytidylate kinase family protein [Candidatus Aenigmarchaeota archaeon]
MAIVCISGLTGSGKNTAGEALAKRTGMRLVSLTFKSEAEKRGIGLMEMQKLAGTDKSIDLNFDKRLVEEASKGDCIVTTWLGPWMIKDASLRIWLHADERVRAERIAKRNGLSVEDALAHLRVRDEDNLKRFKSYYGIDLNDHSTFDLEIDAGKHSPSEIADLIEQALCSKEKA